MKPFKPFLGSTGRLSFSSHKHVFDLNFSRGSLRITELLLLLLNKSDIKISSLSARYDRCYDPLFTQPVQVALLPKAGF